MKSIVVFYSRAGQNYVNGNIVELEKGNTEVVAGMIQKETGSDVFRILPVVKYSENYRECVKEAVADLKQGARPELESYPEHMDQYDRIYLAYPNFCGTMPMPVFTFLEKYDFNGKTVCPICTNEGSGLGNSISDIKKLCPGADVKEGLSIHGAEAGQSADLISEWIRRMDQTDVG